MSDRLPDGRFAEGNQLSKGLTNSGRRRTVSFSEEEMIELGKEMVEWVKLNNPLHLSEWYTIEKMFLYHEWKTFKDRPEFMPYYEVALKLVGKHYINSNSDIHPSIAQRWQRVYFKDLKESEDEEVAYKADITEATKAKYAQKDEPLDKEKANLDTALATVNFLQSVARKMDDIKSNEEQKS